MPWLNNKTFLGETQHPHLLTPDRKPTTDQSTNTTKDQLGEPKSFIGVSYRNMGEGVTYRSRSDSKDGCITKAYANTSDSSQKLGAWDTLHSVQAAQQVRVSFPRDSVGLNLSKPFTGSFAGFCFFQEAALVSGSSLQFGLLRSERDFQLLLIL